MTLLYSYEDSAVLRVISRPFEHNLAYPGHSDIGIATVFGEKFALTEQTRTNGKAQEARPTFLARVRIQDSKSGLEPFSFDVVELQHRWRHVVVRSWLIPTKPAMLIMLCSSSVRSDKIVSQALVVPCPRLTFSSRMQVVSSKQNMLRSMIHFASRDGELICPPTITPLLKELGIRSLWWGISASILRQSTYSTARFGLYNYFASEARHRTGRRQLARSWEIACAGLAGGLAGLVGNPTEVGLTQATTHMLLIIA